MTEDPITFYVVTDPKNQRHPIYVSSKKPESSHSIKVIDYKEYENAQAKIKSLAIQSDVIIAALKNEIEVLKDAKS